VEPIQNIILLREAQHASVGDLNGPGPGGSSDPSQIAIPPISVKQRKRHFAPRTKTGCMTCRKHRVKCDEVKPQCMVLFQSHGKMEVVWANF
jgi:hypothetical protein